MRRRPWQLDPELDPIHPEPLGLFTPTPRRPLERCDHAGHLAIAHQIRDALAAAGHPERTIGDIAAVLLLDIAQTRDFAVEDIRIAAFRRSGYEWAVDLLAQRVPAAHIEREMHRAFREVARARGVATRVRWRTYALTLARRWKA